MKTSNRYRIKTDRIHSLKDLELERQRLQLEILKTEEYIHINYRNILSEFTIGNIAARVVTKTGVAAPLLSKAFSIGKALLEKRKKKKKAEPGQIP